MSQEIRVVPAAVLESALKSLAGVAPGRFAVEAELRAIVDAPVPPDGGEVGIIQCWACRSEFALEAMESNDGCCPACDSEIDLGGYVTRLQAENAALQHRLTIADQRVDDLQTALQAAQTPFPGYPDRHPDEVVKS